MNRYDASIRDALDACGSDLVALTLSAVRIINHLSDLRVPDEIDPIAALEEKTRDALIIALAADGHDVRSHKRKIERLKDENGILFPDVSMAEYKKAYHNIIPFYDYSEGLKRRVNQSVEETFCRTLYTDDFASPRLEEKRQLANKMVFDFLEAFDPKRLIHDAPREGRIPTLVGLKTELLKKHQETYRSAAFFSPPCNIVFWRRHFIVIKNYESDHLTYDFDTAAALFGKDDFMPDRNSFEVDRLFIKVGSHYQYDITTPHIRYVTNLADDVAEAATNAHEAIHLALYRCAAFYEKDEEVAEREFGFTFHDYVVHLVNSAAYDSTDQIRYHVNKEEVLAYAIQAKVYAAQKALRPGRSISS